MKVDCMDFSVCRILALGLEAVTEGCEGGNGLKCLAGTVLLQRRWQFTAGGQTTFS